MSTDPYIETAESIILESREKRANMLGERLYALFDRDKKESLKLKEELKNDCTR